MNHVQSVCHAFAMSKPRPPVPVIHADLLYCTRFVDGDIRWWYYEGPLGKWFCLVGDQEASEWIDDHADVAERVPDPEVNPTQGPDRVQRTYQVGLLSRASA